MPTLHDFSAETLDGRTVDLSEYAGHLVLVVNTASKCGLTPQFEGLQKIYQEYRDREVVVLGFPCGQFKDQEFDTAQEIGEFCRKNYGVDFPMFAKIDVNGPDAHPLYAWLRSQASGEDGEDIEWNFAKFLVGPDGEVIQRFHPTTEPERLRDALDAAMPTPPVN